MTYIDRGLPTTADETPLVETVLALSNEVRDLRASARLRAVIEQAKGVLVQRHGISLDEAFGRLRSMSQEHNVRLVEVAATVVGVALPDSSGQHLSDEVLERNLPTSPASSGTWQRLREQPDVRAGVATAITDSLASAVEQGHSAAELLQELLAPHGVFAVIIYRTGADGSLLLVGQQGMPGDLASSWRSIPPYTDIPYVRAMVEDREYFWGDQQDRNQDFPAASETMSVAAGARAVIPAHEAGRVTGVVGLMWRTDEEFDDARRKTISEIVQRVTPVLINNVTATDPAQEWLQTLLSLHLDPWILLEAAPMLVDGDGTHALTVQAVSPQLPDCDRWIGRRVLEVWPHAAHDGTLGELSDLLRGGGTWTSIVVHRSEGPWGIPGTRVRAVRVGRRIAMVWRWPKSV